MDPLRPAGRSRHAIGAATALLLALLAPHARATDIALAFGTLPSAQGWTFTSGGSPVATEAQTFALGGGVLTLNSMAFGITGAGTSAYYARNGVVNVTEPIVITVRARVLEFEGDFTNTFVGGGFTIGFGHGATYYQMGITPTQIRNVAGTILSTAYNNTQFHDYRLEWSPPSTVRYYVDGTLISTNNAGSASAVNRLLLGDGTGAANSQAEITAYRFLQGAATPAVQGTWGRIKSLVR